MISAVEHPDKPGYVVIAAHRKGHLTGVLSRFFRRETPPPIIFNPKSEYRYEAVMRRYELASLLARLPDEIDYGSLPETVWNDRGRDPVYNKLLRTVSATADMLLHGEDLKENRWPKFKDDPC